MSVEDAMECFLCFVKIAEPWPRYSNLAGYRLCEGCWRKAAGLSDDQPTPAPIVRGGYVDIEWRGTRLGFAPDSESP